MHKNLLLLIALLFTQGLSAQYVLVNSPNDCQGALQFSPTADDWGTMLDSGQWTEDIVIVDDGTAAPSEGCSALINGAEVTGKIAFIDRGSCNFSLKVMNAQNAGAIAVVVASQIPGGGTIVMGAGNFAADVMIPAVMISFEDGKIIKDKIKDGKTVNMSMGNLTFVNDLSIQTGNIVFPKYSTVPVHQAQSADDFIFSLGAAVYNSGSGDGENVTLDGTITHTDGSGNSSVVYEESGSMALIMSDSTRLIVLEDFDPSTTGLGKYDFSYEVSSDNTDEVEFDNSFSGSMFVTNNIYSKARWDEANNRPMQTNGFTIAGGGAIEMIAGFEFPHGADYTIDSVLFYVSSRNPATLAGTELNIILYKWDDANTDEGVTADEIEIVGFAPYTFEANVTATEEWVTVTIEDFGTGDFGYDIPQDGARYFVGTQYTGNEFIFFGVDEGADLDQYVNQVAPAKGTYNDAQLPYLQATSFGAFGADFDAVGLFTDTWACSSTAIYVNPTVNANNDLTDSEATISIFPNPVADELRVEVDLSKSSNSQIEYTILDMQGRIIFKSQRKNISQDVQKFDVSQLSTGTYELIIAADQGRKSKSFVVK